MHIWERKTSFCIFLAKRLPCYFGVSLACLVWDWFSRAELKRLNRTLSGVNWVIQRRSRRSFQSMDRWSLEPGHFGSRGPQAGGRGLVQVRHQQRARRGHARLQHLRHRSGGSWGCWGFIERGSLHKLILGP